MRKAIRKILLKINCIEQDTLARKAQRESEEYHENWAQLMRSGNTVREEDKPMGSPAFIDSVQWGVN